MRPPLILVAHPDESFRGSLESVLSNRGNRVVTATTAEEAFAEATTRDLDAIILDVAVAQAPDFAVLRALRTNPAVSPATPIILITEEASLRTEQLAALRAGAWELRGAPLDTEDLLLRLSAYMQGKREVDRVETDGMVDRASGLYNAIGIARRSEELADLAARQRMALACAVFQPAAAGENVNRLAAAFKQAGRISDAIGRTGDIEVAVFAPATDGLAVRGLVQRLRAAVGGSLRAGASAVTGTERRPPADLLKQARRALEAA